jgi:hypothetical protein
LFQDRKRDIEFLRDRLWGDRLKAYGGPSSRPFSPSKSAAFSTVIWGGRSQSSPDTQIDGQIEGFRSARFDTVI